MGKGLKSPVAKEDGLIDRDKAKFSEYPMNLLFAQNMMCMSLGQAQQWEMYYFMLYQNYLMQETFTRGGGIIYPQIIPQAFHACASRATATTNQAMMGVMQNSQDKPISKPSGADVVAQDQSLSQRAQGNVDLQRPVAPASAAAQGQRGTGEPAAQAKQDQAQLQPQGDPNRVQPAVQPAVFEQGAQVAAPEQAPLVGEERAEGAPEEENIWQRFRLGSIVKVALIMILLEVKPVWFFVYFFAVFLYLGGILDPVLEWFRRNAADQPLEMQLRNLNRRRERADQSEEDAQGHGADNPAGREEGGEVAQNGNAGPPPPPFLIRFIYQLFVMFVMTLLPMWNPDPVYLQ